LERLDAAFDGQIKVRREQVTWAKAVGDLH